MIQDKIQLSLSGAGDCSVIMSPMLADGLH